MYVVIVYVTETQSKSQRGAKQYRCVLLRESYREGGRVRNRTIANLSHCKPQEIAAIRLALEHKDDLGALVRLRDVQVAEGLSLGAVWTVYDVARRLGVEEALGRDRAGRLAMWQVIARMDQDGDGKLAAAELGLDADMFQRVDRDGDGKVTAEELAAAQDLRRTHAPELRNNLRDHRRPGNEGNR